jgi:hypothetical protein
MLRQLWLGDRQGSKEGGQTVLGRKPGLFLAVIKQEQGIMGLGQSVGQGQSIG